MEGIGGAVWTKEAADGRCIMRCRGSSLKLSGDMRDNAWVTMSGEAECRHTLGHDDQGNLMITTTISNPTDKPLALHDVPFLNDMHIVSEELPFTHAFVECQALLGDCGPQELSEEKAWYSWGIAGLTDRLGRQALLLGMENVDDHFYHFVVQKMGKCTLAA